MPHVIHDPIEPSPLESFESPIERDVSLRYRDALVTVGVRAGWAQLELTVTEPSHLAGISESRGNAGFAAAMAAHADPSRRFTYHGELTARAIRIAQQFIIKVLNDHETVKHHAAHFAECCLAAHDRIERIDAQIRELSRTPTPAALRRACKNGELAQCDYQAIVKVLTDHRRERQSELAAARRNVEVNAAGGLGGASIPLDQALIHLSDPTIRATLPAAMCERVDALGRDTPNADAGR